MGHIGGLRRVAKLHQLGQRLQDKKGHPAFKTEKVTTAIGGRKATPWIVSDLATDSSVMEESSVHAGSEIQGIIVDSVDGRDRLS
jgi:hypothetical protein